MFVAKPGSRWPFMPWRAPLSFVLPFLLAAPIAFGLDTPAADNAKKNAVVENPQVTFGGAAYAVGFSTYADTDDAITRRNQELQSLCLRYDIEAKTVEVETTKVPDGDKLAVMEVVGKRPTGRVARVDTAMTINGHSPQVVSKVICKSSAIAHEAAHPADRRAER